MIEIKNLSKTYQSGSTGVRALKNVSLTINAGEFVAIMGASGSGKSTLLHILGFLDRPDGGSYKINGREIAQRTDDELAGLRNNLAGFVFQQFHLLPRISALENTELPLIYAGRRHLLEKAMDKIKLVGLFDRAKHRPNQMSGGQQQRVAIARALVNDPLIIFADEPTGNLDSKSELEIMEVLKKLNAEGKTIIMVTHEQEIAENAGRIIRMRDGEIISDERTHPLASATAADASARSSELLSEGAAVGNSIELLDYLRQSFQAIFSNKLRSFLSMLGITIGVAAVIAMSALGEGAKSSISKELSSLGSNILTVAPGSFRRGGVTLASGAVTRFTLKDAEAIGKLTQVKAISPAVRGTAQAVFYDKNCSTTLYGVDIAYESMKSAVPPSGKFFSKKDLRERKKVAVVGQTVVTQLFGTNSPLGKQIKINRNNFTVIGVLPIKGSSGPMDQDDVIVIPITTAMHRILGKEYVDSIDVEINSSATLAEAEKEIKQLIMKRHKLNSDSSFQVRNMSEIRTMIESTTKTMSMLLGAIAAISLLVGGIGIMNIMLVSVTERTKEIGLRKAIGARNKDILTQFLIEAIVMTSSGGILGLMIGAGAAGLIAVFTGWSVLVTAQSVLVAVFFSVFVGLVFGISPAKQAAQMNPIEALRYE